MVSIVASKTEGSGLKHAGQSVWSLCILPVPVWVLSSFFPQSKNIHASLIGDSKPTTGVDITA